MDTDRTKELLRAIHSCKETACQKDCDAACTMLEEDPELQAWFEQEFGGWSAFDRAVAEKLKCCETPEGLEGRCRSAACSGRGRSSAPRFLIPLAAAAAMLVAGFYVGRALFDKGSERIVVHSEGVDITALRSTMAELVSNRDFAIQHQGDEFGELMAWLAEEQAPTGEIKQNLLDKSGIGCAVIHWNGNAVSMICFGDKALGGSGVVHLFTVDRSIFGEADVETLIAEHHRSGGLDTRGWASADRVFLMVGDDPEVRLDGLL